MVSRILGDILFALGYNSSLAQFRETPTLFFAARGLPKLNSLYVDDLGPCTGVLRVHFVL